MSVKGVLSTEYMLCHRASSLQHANLTAAVSFRWKIATDADST
jgi:hypothetical protein